MHGLGHVDVNYDLAAGSHSRNDAFVTWEADRQVHVVSAHLVQTTVHDKREWLFVSSVDDLVVLEWVLDPLKQLLSLNRLY